MKENLLNLVITLMIVFAVFGVAIITDQVFYNSRYMIKYYYGEDAGFVVPEDWQILTDGNLYAVKNKHNMYLYQGRFGTSETYITIAKPSLMLNEANAKAYLKAYLKSKEPKISGFREVSK